MIGRSRFGLYIGQLFGIRFYLDYSWFLIAAIVTYELSAQLFPASLPGESQTLYFTMGIIAALAFFLSILLHELGHSIVSQRCGIPVPRITLLFIGGIAEIAREPDNARAELQIAAGGPIVSIGLAALYAACAFLFDRLDWQPASQICQFLAFVNVTLVVFNSIPGYPLDGGRILRAIIWARTRNLRKATFIATRIGVGFSWVLLAAGMAAIFYGYLNALVLIIIGMFLKTTAETGYTNTLHHEVLGKITVGGIMTRDPVCIPAHTPLSMAVDEYFLAKNHVAYPVVNEHGGFRGLLRLEYLKELPRDKWAFTTAGDLAASHEHISSSIDAAQSAELAMRRLSAGQGRLAVLEDGCVTGILTRHDVLHYITIHTELESGAADSGRVFHLNPGDMGGRL